METTQNLAVDFFGIYFPIGLAVIGLIGLTILFATFFRSRDEDKEP